MGKFLLRGFFSFSFLAQACLKTVDMECRLKVFSSIRYDFTNFILTKRAVMRYPYIFSWYCKSLDSRFLIWHWIYEKKGQEENWMAKSWTLLPNFAWKPEQNDKETGMANLILDSLGSKCFYWPLNTYPWSSKPSRLFKNVNSK